MGLCSSPRPPDGGASVPLKDQKGVAGRREVTRRDHGTGRGDGAGTRPSRPGAHSARGPQGRAAGPQHRSPGCPPPPAPRHTSVSRETQLQNPWCSENSVGLLVKKQVRTRAESAQDGPEEAAQPPAGPGGVQPRACFMCVCRPASHRAGHAHGTPYSPPGGPGLGGSQPGPSRARRAHEVRSQSPPTAVPQRPREVGPFSPKDELKV